MRFHFLVCGPYLRYVPLFKNIAIAKSCCKEIVILEYTFLEYTEKCIISIESYFIVYISGEIIYVHQNNKGAKTVPKGSPPFFTFRTPRPKSRGVRNVKKRYMRFQIFMDSDSRFRDSRNLDFLRFFNFLVQCD